MQIDIFSQDPMLTKSLELMLSGANLGVEPVCHSDLDDAKRDAACPDLVIVDAHLPGSVLADYHAFHLANRADVPVLVVVGSDRGANLPVGYEDADHLVTPFHRGDLLARVYANRRASEADGGVLAVGELELDLKHRKAQVRGQTVPLTAKEYEVLEFLAVRKGTTLTKEMFLDRLYGGIDEPEVKIIDVFVCKIRRKLKMLSGGDPLIDTVWGRGYVLRDPQEREAERAAAKERAAG
jgi:two-component system cell cycle response regulator CtrA